MGVGLHFGRPFPINRLVNFGHLYHSSAKIPWTTSHLQVGGLSEEDCSLREGMFWQAAH